MKKINEEYFLLKLNESQDNQTRKFYCGLIELQKKFDSEYKIENYYYLSKIYYDSNNIFPIIQMENTVITYIKYFLNDLDYSPLPKTIFYLNSILLMIFKLLLDSNNLSNLIILYSKFLPIIKDEKIKEIIKTNKSLKYTKNKIIELFKEAKKKFEEQLDTRKNFFSILFTERKFQDNNNKTEKLFNNLEIEIKNILNKKEKNKKEYIIDEFTDVEDEKSIYYLINIDWLHKFLAFKKFLDEVIEDMEGYNYFLFTGFDADNVILNIINNYKTIKKNIVSYIGPIINEHNILNYNVMIDPKNIFNTSILTNDYIFINEKLYFVLSDFFGIDFEIKREKKYINISFNEIMILNDSLRKRDISSLCKEIISFENDITYEELKLKIIRCIKYKYDKDFNGSIINIYIYQYNNNFNNKEHLNIQNFYISIAYGFNLIDKLYINCEKLTSENFNSLIIHKENSINDNFLYFEILENENDTPFIININENYCIFCNKKIKEKSNIIYCDESEKCLNKYCSPECKNNDKKHINFHVELNKYYIQNITIDKLLNKEISFPKDSKMGLTGLTNLGNTCYINSSLQCLSNCFQLTKYFLSNLYLDDINIENKNGTGGKILKCYKKLLKNLWKKNYEYINPDKFNDIFIINEKELAFYGQNDASEFLIFLLDKLHQDLNRANNKEIKYISIQEKLENENDSKAALRWWKNHIKRENSIIVNLFHGQLRNKIICNECKKDSIIFDPFMILPLQIPSNLFTIEIKYFGFNFGDFHLFNISINEENNIYDIKKKILSNLNNWFNEDKKNNNKNLIKKKKINKKKNKIENNKTSNEKIEVILNEITINSIELILLTKDKKIYKIVNDENFDILYYINNGFELVVYEKEELSDNIYFYLIHYTNEYLLWLFPYIKKNFLFEYPIPLSIKNGQNIYDFYQKIYQYINELKLSNEFIKDELINLNDALSNINYQNEEKIGYVVYVNNDYQEGKLRESICNKIYNYFIKSYNNFRILEKFFMKTKYEDIKERLSIDNNKRLILNIDILNTIDLSKFPKFEKKEGKIKHNSKINLYDCLDLFVSEEKIDENVYYCSKCKKYNKFTKKMDLYKEPYYLIILLKRFKKNKNKSDRFFINNFNIFNNIKKTTFVDFPVQNLDISNYIIGCNDNQRALYNLIGVINHFGGGFYGHYTSNCLNRNKWYKFDDEIISEIDKDKISTNSAYILFYQKST